MHQLKQTACICTMQQLFCFVLSDDTAMEVQVAQHQSRHLTTRAQQGTGTHRVKSKASSESTVVLADREGKTKWEDLELDDVDLRLKWSGLFHRRKRAPGTFMMRLKVLSTLHATQALIT